VKGIVLRDFEVRRLASAGSVLIWRRVNPQPCLDFPTGFRIQKQYPLTHHPECSFKHGMLCDCGAIDVAWKAELESRCTHCRDGDTRFVKETWRSWDEEQRIIYKADYQPIEMKMRWKSPASMPAEASRFNVTLSVSCRQIQSVTEEQAERSGAEFGFWHEDQGMFSTPVDEDDEGNSCFRDGFGFVIESRHPGSWERKDWFWAIEAKEVK